MRLRPAVLLVFLLAPLAHATSVVAPSFAELVGEADAIYRGQVTAVSARRVAAPADGGSIIKTFVTVAVERTLKGPETREVTLEFLGGTVGDDSMAVSGMPKFTVGAREIVFVQRNGIQFCPLVAMMHGRYHVNRDAASGRDYMVRDNGVPLTDPADVQLPMTALPEAVRLAHSAAAVTRALTPTAFEASITSEVQRLQTTARPH